MRPIAVNEGVDTGLGFDDDFLPLPSLRQREKGIYFHAGVPNIPRAV